VTQWIVDGMNLIGSRPDGWWRDRPGAMRSLAAELGRFAAASGESVTVVFDGRPVQLGDHPEVEVAFASRRGPNAADDDIAVLVAGASRPGELTVVTSDAALAERVSSNGAGVVGVRAFRERLDSSREAAGGF
jgi:predicted RNA-binding protein with PIN domain